MSVDIYYMQYLTKKELPLNKAAYA